jgi:C_GCAxxG_C_C family probable redox protein
MEEIQQAIKYFEQEYSCSQAVFAAFSPRFGLPAETALKIACSFGAGMGRMGEVCGAASGAYMVFGLAHGSTLATDKESKEKVYALVRQHADRFRQIHGSILCRELLGCRLDTPEGLQQARQSGIFDTRCPLYVKDSAVIVDELLDRL